MFKRRSRRERVEDPVAEEKTPQLEPEPSGPGGKPRRRRTEDGKGILYRGTHSYSFHTICHHFYIATVTSNDYCCIAKLALANDTIQMTKCYRYALLLKVVVEDG